MTQLFTAVLKKLIVTILLGIHLFNIGGHLAMYQYVVYQSNRFYNEQVNKNLYNINDLTEVKIPVNLKGITNWKNYENISGQIQFDNTSYNYVKMKLTRTIMYLMCIPNYQTTRFASDNVLRAKGVKGYPVPQKDHVAFGKTTVLDNFHFTALHFEFVSPSKKIQKNVVESLQHLVYHHPDIPEQPPRLSC
ncbi:hypothetical protein [Mucilaginibacter sp. SP1R1]|uniref:hypothetical protein n=1 Tax=Mucilaginibacter sp. SP1R1 TaxID=2723091 RepID=UPI001611BC4E|nr:hypothetical protein [Mucilaginibacter sp. SP1R1]MBB6151504.1 hypothetical protein [Mucilaginibacter sp. SP1R1]